MSLPVIRPQWPAPDRVEAFTTTRAGGVSKSPWNNLNLGSNCGDDRLNVLKNREIVSAITPAPPAWLKQTHGTDVVRHEGNLPPEVEADAVIAETAGRVCAVLTADCLPVLLTNTGGTEVAAVHAGWRGLAAGILENTVNCMRSQAPEILAWIGPGIGPSAYQVGSEVRDAFCTDDALAETAFKESGQRWMANLPLLARQRLARCGVSRVFGGEECTFSDEKRFFSCRRDGDTGRMATLIWLR